MHTRQFAVPAALATAGLWQHGRLQRAWLLEKSVRRAVDWRNVDSRKMFVYFGGAFTQASRQAAMPLHKFCEHGSVMSWDYGYSRFNPRGVYDDAYRQLRLRRASYDELVVVGGSVGAVNAFRLAREFHQDVETSLLVIDPLLSRNGLPRDARVMGSLLGHARPGPVFNSLGQPLIPQLIPGRDPAIWEPGVDAAVVSQMHDMHRITLSYFLDVAGSLPASPPDPSGYVNMRVLGLFSEFEPTLDQQGKVADFEYVTQLADMSSHVVLGAHHLTFVEQEKLWSSHFDRVLLDV